MITAHDFLNLLQERDLIDAALIQGLRARLTQSTEVVPAARVVEYLVEKGLLSASLASRLLEQAEDQKRAQSSGSGLNREEAGISPPPEKDLGLAPIEEDLLDVAGAFDEPSASGHGGATPDQLVLDDEAARKPEGLRYAMIDDDPPYARPLSTSQPLPPENPSAGVPPRPATVGSVQPSPLDTAILLGGTQDEFAAPGWDAAGNLPPAVAKKRRASNPWESKLLLFGGALLLLLLVLLPVLIWRITSHSAEEMLAAADADYSAGAYTRAIARYTDYLDAFPNDPAERVGRARVRRALARIRQVTDAGADWPGALATAQEEIRSVSGESVFAAEARAELIALLPTIAENLARKAYELKTPDLVALSEQAVAIVERYLPSADRPTKRMNDILSLLMLTQREIARETRLQAAIEQMDKAIASESPRPAEAYAIRDALLKDYPDLIGDPKLREYVGRVSRVEGSVVRWSETGHPARDAAAPDLVPTLVLAATRTMTPVVTSTPLTVYAQTREALYGLDGSTGVVLWRRARSTDQPLAVETWPPVSLDELDSSDAIAVADVRRIERLDARTGLTRWTRLLDGNIIAQPTLMPGRALVPIEGGRLVHLDIETGAEIGYIQFPQPLTTSAVVIPQREMVLAVGEHSTLFVLSGDGQSCADSVHLGHQPGTIRVPPAVMGRHLLVVAQESVHSSTLRVHALENDEGTGQAAKTFSLLQEVKLAGRVDQTPQVQGQRALVATDIGDVKLLAVAGPGTAGPLQVIAETAIDSSVSGPINRASDMDLRYSYLGFDNVWIGDRQLAQYDIQASRRRLTPRASVVADCVTWQPLRAVGTTLYHVRRDRAWPGWVVAAVSTTDGAMAWETRVGVPLVTTPTLDDDRKLLSAVTVAGAIYEIPFDRMTATRGMPQTIISNPTATLQTGDFGIPLTHRLPLDEGRVALIAARGQADRIDPKAEPSSGRERIAIYDPDTGSRFRWVTLPSPMAAPPAVMDGGLLVPCQSGQILLLDPKTGRALAEPSQLPMRPGRAPRTFQPVVVADEEAVVLHNNELLRVEIVAQPRRHLAVSMIDKVDRWVVGAPAVLDERVFVPAADIPVELAAGDAGRNLPRSDLIGLVWSLQDGKPAPPVVLSQDCAIVPPYDLLALASHVVYLAMPGEEPCWFDRSGRFIHAQGPTSHEALAAAMQLDESTLHVFSTSGRWTTFSAVDGAPRDVRHLSFTVGCPPIVLDNHWWFADRTGTLHAVSPPR